MNNLKKLIDRCVSVNLESNLNKTFYESVAEYFYNQVSNGSIKDIPKDVYDKMIELDCIIEITFYPDNPIGFHVVYHYDLDMAIKEALSILGIE
jgi:hypothetical protein